ncbi:MAG TPA: hypothetical protein VKE70_03325 [Candidatus Solibacter sp.]|nr:hypothetical protein [Candidatus Solibacter sp.]
MTALLLGESRIILETERLAADGFLDRAVRGLAVSPLLLALAEAAGKRSPVAGSDAATFVAAQPSRKRGGQRQYLLRHRRFLSIFADDFIT